MILYNDNSKQDFLSPYIVKEMLDLGIKMNDSRYNLYKIDGSWYIQLKSDVIDTDKKIEEQLPTYTLSEILNKLSDCPFTKVKLSNGFEVILRELYFIKNILVNVFGYKCTYIIGDSEYQYKDKEADEWTGIDELPIVAAAKLLIKCKKGNIPYKE